MSENYVLCFWFAINLKTLPLPSPPKKLCLKKETYNSLEDSTKIELIFKLSIVRTLKMSVSGQTGGMVVKPPAGTAEQSPA